MPNEVTEFESTAFEHMVGPPEEMDKLMAVNWNMIGSTDMGSDSPCSYYKVTRESENRIRLDYVFDLHPYFDDEF